MSYLEVNKKVLWEEYSLTPGMDLRSSLNLANKELSCPIVIIVQEGTVKGTPSIALHGFDNIEKAMQKLVEDMVSAFSPDRSSIEYAILDKKSVLLGCILQGRPVKLVPSVTGVAVLIKDSEGEYSLLSGVVDTKTIEVLDNERKEGEATAETGTEADGGSEGQDVEACSESEQSEDSGC